MEKVQKKDFIEIEFTGIIKTTNQIFDTNSKENAEKHGIKDAKPLKICVGEKMVVRGLDAFIEGKEVGKEYTVELPPEAAFGIRRPDLIKIIPVSVFKERNFMPQQGMVLDMDGIAARVSSVNGGRVTVDFNYPLAGKIVVYDIKILRKIDEPSEKLKALSEFFMDESDAKIEGSKGIVTLGKKVDKMVLDAFSKKVKELLNLEVEFKEKPSEKEKK